jgi:CRISPR type IV-associated protein Csf3
MNKESLRVEITIGSQIIMPKYPIHIDALLYAALEANSDWNESEIIAYLDEILDQENGIYKASAMRFLQDIRNPVTTKQVSFATRTHWEEWDIPISGNEKSITTKGGPFRKRVTTYNAISAHLIDFHVVGNAEKIKFLLNLLGFIGLGNNQGFGEIMDISIERSEDYSFFDEHGELARNLPISMIDQHKIQDYLNLTNSVKPPYINSKRVLSCVPNFRIATIRS